MDLELDAVPLPTLLSWALVAFTIELDNEFEHQMTAATRRRPFRASLVVWENYLRIVGDGPLRVSDLGRLAGVSERVHPYLAVERWGYVVTESDPIVAALRARCLHPTATGRHAATIWGRSPPPSRSARANGSAQLS
jgi:hypothetical protein